MSSYPSISIIIPSYNQGIYIERTLLSILKQDYPGEVQVIVSDGGSKDETVEILKKYPQIIWWSQQDKGFVDAVMKGMAVAKGDILAIQSSDDFYLKDAFKISISELISHPNLDIIAGAEVRLEPDLKTYCLSPTFSYNLTPRTLLLERGIPQHCAFFRRRVLDKIGGLRAEVDTCADTDFWYRALHFFEGRLIPVYTAVYQLHPNQRTQVLTNFASSLMHMVESCETDPLYGQHFKLSSHEKQDIYTKWEIDWMLMRFNQLSNQELILLEQRINEILQSSNYSEPMKYKIRQQALSKGLIEAPPPPNFTGRVLNAIQDGTFIRRVARRISHLIPITKYDDKIDLINWWQK
jgi:glycosyltransferase involved in cell wall biosynthesis